MFAVFRILPLLFLVVLVYLAVLFSGGVILGGTTVGPEGGVDMQGLLNSELFTISMVSGDFTVTRGAIFVFFGLIAMFIEVLRATDTSAVSITNHALSAMILVACLVLFIVVQGCNTLEFFYLTVMAAIDVVAGFTVSIVAARRDFGGTGVITG